MEKAGGYENKKIGAQEKGMAVFSAHKGLHFIGSGEEKCLASPIK